MKPADLRDDRLKEAKIYILKTIASRKVTDRIVSWVWILIMILIPIVSIVVAVVLFIISVPMWLYGTIDSSTLNILLEILVTSAIAATTAVYSCLAFVLVRRQNDHFARDRALREGIMTLLRTASDPSGRSTLVMNEFSAMNAANNPKEEYHDERIWAVLMLLPLLIALCMITMMSFVVMGTSAMIMVTMIPLMIIIVVGEFLAMLYLLYFLGKQIYEHSERWLVFEQNAKSVMIKLQWPQIVRMKMVRLEKREFAIYLILNIFIPFFSYYWWYTLIKDPNTHFESQWEFEDRLAEIISK